MAAEECKSGVGESIAQPEQAGKPAEEQNRAGKGTAKPARTDSGTVMRLSVDELLRLAPRLRSYVGSPAPAWPEIVDAADWLRGELGVSRSLWVEACGALGREQAAIAIAIVSAKPAAHFRSTPGGYFHGMVAKAKAGELNLARTVWGLRQAGAAKPGPRPEGRGGGGVQ